MTEAMQLNSDPDFIKAGTGYLEREYHYDTDILRFSESAPTSANPTKRPTILLHMPQEVEPKVLVNVDEMILGRGDKRPQFLDLSLQYAKVLGVSREHAKIIFEDGCYFLQDLGSLNGTFINDYQAIPNKNYLLESGDKIRLGHMLIVIAFG